MVFPRGSYMGFGFGGQYLVIVPSCRLVVVNLVDTGRSRLARLRWLAFGDAVEAAELGSLLRPILRRAGCSPD